MISIARNDKEYNPEIEIIDAETVKSFALTIGLPVEMRVVKSRKRTIAGYYDDPERLAADLESLVSAEKDTGKIEAFYLTLNEINPDLLARAKNRFEYFVKTTTGDHEIIRRRWLLIDCDPQRPTGISSTDEEHWAAIEMTYRIRDYLSGFGFSAPIVGDSGNGGHLLYRIDLPNDDETARIVSDFLNCLADRFNSEAIHIDRTVFNAARISKLYGTWVRKGDECNGRKHRLSRILERPERIEVVPVELIQAVIAGNQPSPVVSQALAGLRGMKTTSGASTNDPEALSDWLEAKGIEFKGPQPYRDGYKWNLSACPLCGETDHSAVVMMDQDGKRAFKCHHNRCSGLGWKDFRAKLEPERVVSASAETTERSEGGKPGWDDIIQDWDTFLAIADSQTEDWLLPGIAEFGTLGLLTGLPFGGKSTLVADLLVSIVTGRLFGDLPAKQCPFILLDLENRERITAKRLRRALGEDQGQMRRFFNRVNPGAIELPLTPDFVRSVVNRLRSTIDALGGRCLIVIDTLRTAKAGSGLKENDEEDMVGFLAPFKKLAAETGSFILVLHHNSKGRNAYSGSTAIAGVADYLWNWTVDQSNYTAELEFVGRDDAQSPMLFQYDLTTQRNGFVGRKNFETARKASEQSEREMISLLALLPADEWVKQSDIERQASAELGMSQKKYLNRVGECVQRQYLEKKEGGSGKPNTLKLTDLGVIVAGRGKLGL